MGAMNRLNVERMLSGKSRSSFTVNWTPQELLHRHAVRKRKILFMTGKYTKTSIQRSMRYSKKRSEPGKPPNAHKDSKKGPLLRKLVAFAVDVEADSVVAGPMKAGNVTAPTTPEVLDQGGRVPVARLLSERTIKIGDRGPIKYLGAGKFINIPILTEAQAARANRLRAEENAVRAGKGTIKIAARPFTKPALTDGGKKLRELTENIPL